MSQNQENYLQKPIFVTVEIIGGLRCFFFSLTQFFHENDHDTSMQSWMILSSNILKKQSDPNFCFLAHQPPSASTSSKNSLRFSPELFDPNFTHHFFKIGVHFQKLISGQILTLTSKVYIFWEGHKIFRNLHLTFVLCSAGLM